MNPKQKIAGQTKHSEVSVDGMERWRRGGQQREAGRAVTTDKPHSAEGSVPHQSPAGKNISENIRDLKNVLILGNFVSGRFT